MEDHRKIHPDQQPPSADGPPRPDREREDRLVQTLSRFVLDFVVCADDRRTRRVPPVELFWDTTPGYKEKRFPGQARTRQEILEFLDEVGRRLGSADVLDVWALHQILKAVNDYLAEDGSDELAINAVLAP